MRDTFPSPSDPAAPKLPAMPFSVSWAFLAVSAVGAWFTWNAVRPPRWPATLATVCFFAGWLTVELAAHHLVWQLVATGAFVYHGALDDWPGMVALGLCVVSWATLIRLHRRGHLAAEAMQDALDALGPLGLGRPEGAAAPAVSGAEDEVMLRADPEAGLTTKDLEQGQLDDVARPLRVRHYVSPFQMRQRGVSLDRGRLVAEVDGRKLRADVYYREDRPAGAPVLVFVHGGGWVIGFKQYQALPMMNRLASQGWVCVSVDYRLSPRATFPDHIADVNRGIAWAKAHASEYGGDPAFVAVSGNSAGGHLSALAALTWDDPTFKPGFEAVDTRVQAAVTFYGVYDLTDRFGHWPHRGIRDVLELAVFKKRKEEAPELFEAASPLSRVRRDAPPWLVVHGTHDTLVPVSEARRFSEALREVSDNPVCYAEVPDAQHAFEIFRSVRGHHTLRAVAAFLRTIHRRRITVEQK